MEKYIDRIEIPSLQELPTESVYVKVSQARMVGTACSTLLR
jgi:hypothetical protein